MALAVLPPVGAILFRLLGATLRFEDIGEPASRQDRCLHGFRRLIWQPSQVRKSGPGAPIFWFFPRLGTSATRLPHNQPRGSLNEST